LELVRTPQPESFRYLLILTGPTDPDKQIWRGNPRTADPAPGDVVRAGPAGRPDFVL